MEGNWTTAIDWILEKKWVEWNWIGHTLQKCDDCIAKPALQWTPQGRRSRGRPRNTWKRSVERNVDSGFQIQLEKDALGSKGQSSMEKSGLLPMRHWERKGVSQVSEVSQWFTHSVENKCATYPHIHRTRQFTFVLNSSKNGTHFNVLSSIIHMTDDPAGRSSIIDLIRITILQKN